jgi:hypothetical protein
MRRRLLVLFGFLIILIGVFGVSQWVDAHPFAFRAPPGASQAFSWDTTPEVLRRGSCAPGSGRVDPRWRPQPGRYLLTMLIPDGPNRWRPIRGRLWLGSVDGSANRAGSARRPASGSGMETILRGATDLDLSRAFAPAAFAPLEPPARSTDPTMPGVVVALDSATNQIMLVIGSGVMPPSERERPVAPVVEFRITQGVGDGFAGSWRGGDSTVSGTGYFCAGWIEV